MGILTRTTKYPYLLSWSQEEWHGPYFNPHSDEEEPVWGPVLFGIFKLNPRNGQAVGNAVITVEVKDKQAVASLVSSLEKECSKSLVITEDEMIALLLTALCKEHLIRAESGEPFSETLTDKDLQNFWKNSKQAVLAEIPIVIRETGRFTFTTTPPGYFTEDGSLAWIEHGEMEEIALYEEEKKFERERNPGVKLAKKLAPTIKAGEVTKVGQIEYFDWSRACVGDKKIKLTPIYNLVVALLLRKKVLSPPGIHEEKIFRALSKLYPDQDFSSRRMATLERKKISMKGGPKKSTYKPNPALGTVILKGSKASYYLNSEAAFPLKKKV